METTILFAAAIAIAVFSFLIGLIVSATFDLTVRISHKEDYEAKVKQFETLIADLEEKLTEQNLEAPENPYHANDLFPPDLGKDFGVPKELK